MNILVISSSYPMHQGDPSGHFVESEVRLLLEQGHDVWLVRPGRVGRVTEVSAERPRGTSTKNHTETNAASSEHASGRLTQLLIPAGEAFGFPGIQARLSQGNWLEKARRGAQLLGFMHHAHYTAKALRDRLGRFDLLQLHWLVPNGFPIAPRNIAKRVEVVAHGSDIRLLARLPKPAARLILEKILRSAEERQLRTVSHQLLGELAAFAPPELIRAAEVRPCALDLTGVPTRKQAREELRIPEAGELWLVIARLIPAKRVPIALRALELLNEVRPIQAVVIGEGPEGPQLVENFPQVKFLGALPRSACLTWLAAADGLINASRAEGSPTSIREARALGVRVVSTDCGDLKRWAASDPGIDILP